MPYRIAGALVILLAFGVVVSCIGKGKVIHPTDTIEVPRKVLVQARGKVRVIYNRVRTLEQAACTRRVLTPKQCAESDAIDQQFRRDQRELDALLEVPDYEVDWGKFLNTLDSVGSILDKLPVP